MKYEEEIFKLYADAVKNDIVDGELITETTITFPRMYSVDVLESEDGEQFAILTFVNDGMRTIISGKKEDVFRRGGL